MFYKPLIILLLVLFFQACKTKQNVKVQYLITSDTLAVKRYLSNKQLDSAMLLADQILGRLKQLGNSNAYIQYCENFTENLIKAGGDWKSQKKYYNNICKCSNERQLDSLSHKYITNAYFNWAYISAGNEHRADDSIIIYWEKAISLNKEKMALRPADEAYSYRRLGILYNEIGDLRKTLRYYTLEEKFTDTSNKNWVAINTINKTIAMKELGQFDSAAQLINKILVYPKVSALRRAELFTIMSDIQNQQKLNIAAGVSIHNAISILDTFKNSTVDVEEKCAQAWVQKGIVERAFRDFTASLASQKRALEYYKATGNLEGRNIAKIYIELGKSYEGAGLYDSALKNYQLAISKVVKMPDAADYSYTPSKQQVYAENAIMEALDAKAAVLQLKYKQNADLKFLALAVQSYKISFEVERKLMQNFSYDESRLIMLKESKKRSAIAIGLCYQLFQLTKNDTWSEEAFLIAEKSKAVVLLESIKRNIAANTILQNDSVFQRIQYLITRLNYVNKEISQLNNVKDDSLFAVYRNQQDIINNELLIANNDLSRNNASYKILTDKDDSLSVTVVKNKVLDEHTAVIEFFSSDSATYIFHCIKDAHIGFFKTTDTVTKILQEYLSFFTDKSKINNHPAAYQAVAYALYRELNFSAVNDNAISKLVIIPDGNFNLLPFEALVSVEKNEDNPKNWEYLLLHKQISYNYSIAVILKQMEQTPHVSGNNMICFAPVFANSERGYTPLLHTEEEYRDIQKKFPEGHYFSGRNATVGNFKNEIKNAGIIHIASHASADIINEFNQPKIEFFDSSLYLNELYTLRINPDLVVLSACETGIGVINKSEGAMSLARGFYYAGAKNVITSLWNVNDKSTAGLFADFYSNIKQKNYSAALQNAKLDYIKNASSVSASPYYWASFIHHGYSSDEKKTGYWLWLIVACILLVLILFLFQFKK